MSKKILFLIPYPLRESPSQRFRFEQYFSSLEENGLQFFIQSFLGKKNWKIFFKPGRSILKILTLLAGFSKRLVVLFRVPFYDVVFIHREATPLGPPVFEWMIAKVFGKKIIYDFDDAIWLTDRLNETWWTKALKYRKKVSLICEWSYKVSCGNQYLTDFARTYNQRAVRNPTTIETQQWHNPGMYEKKRIRDTDIIIGWTGSHSTLKYLKDIESVLQRIESNFPLVKVLIIADQKPSLNLRSLVFVPWNEKTEIEDLMLVDIGIMPLPDDEWSRGKCGFKALQYMALEIPAIASPVGVNSTIIDAGKNGFLCSTPEEWENALTTLIRDSELRKKMGTEGRIKVESAYSVTSNSSNFLALFE